MDRKKKTRGPKGVPAIRAPKPPVTAEFGRVMHRWWNRTLAENSGKDAGVTLQSMVSDVGTVGMMHLMKRMHSTQTPLDVKDRIALAVVPKFSAEIKRRIKDDDSLGELMGAYRIGT